jgi:hypothetical protein
MISTAFERDKLREIAAMESWWVSSDLVMVFPMVSMLTPSTISPLASKFNETATEKVRHITTLARAVVMSSCAKKKSYNSEKRKIRNQISEEGFAAKLALP